MKLLFVTNSLYGGGSEKMLVQLANYMCSRGHDVTILSYIKNGEERVDPAINLLFLKNNSVLMSIIRIRKIIKALEPSAVISFEYSVNICTCLASFALHKKIIISERNDPSRVGGTFFKKRIRNLSYCFATALVCQTNDAKAYFPQRIQKKASVIMNPVSSGLPFGSNTNARKKEIVNFCRLHKQKNIPLLIDAFDLFYTAHPDYVLKIYGDGPEKDALLAYAKTKRSKDNIFFLEAIDNVHFFVSNSSMFVSSSDYEGLSNSMIEAMAIGLPTIATDCPCGGARMVIKDGVNGFLTPVNDAILMCQKMCRIAESPELAKELSTNAIKLRTELSPAKIMPMWEALIS